MQLAIHGLANGPLDRFTPEVPQGIGALGFAGAAINVAGPVEQLVENISRCRDVGRMFAGAGVALVGFGQYNTDFVHLDPAIRSMSVRRLQLACQVAEALGSTLVNFGTGSRNRSTPHGAWCPHPENHTDEALDLFVSGVREAAGAAEDAGVKLALEPHRNTVCYSPERAMQAFAAIGSPAVGANLDFVNWLESHQVYRAGAAVRHMVNVLGDRAFSVHAKDVQVEDRLVFHYNEAVTGTGVLDYPEILRALAGREGADPHLPFIIEHLPAEAMPAARDFTLRAAREAGVPFAP